MKWKIGLLCALLFSGFQGLESSSNCCDTTTADCCDDCNSCSSSSCQFGKTFFHLREATQNTPFFEMMGSADKMHLFDKDCEFYGAISVGIGYERTQDTCGFGKVFAFNDSGITAFSADSNRSTFTGTDEVIKNADSNARAVDFGLSPSFNGTLVFKPRIEKVIIDFDLFIGFDECINGLWGRINAPIIHAKYNLDPCQSTTTTGGVNYPAGFVDTATTVVTVPYDNIKTAWNNLGTFGDVAASGCGKLPCSSQRKTKLGGVSLDLGYDFVRCECFALGISLHGVIPTANAPRATTLFTPIAGTHNWQLGGTINAHWTAWSCDDNQQLTFYAYCVMTHLFKDRQVRLFGLNVGGETAGNSWLLLKKFNASNVYDGEVVRASSMLGRSLKSGNNFMSDLSLMLQYKRCKLDFSLGYNFWYRSKDTCSTSCQDGDTSPCRGECYGKFTEDTYGIKGVSSVASAGTANQTFYSKADSNIHDSGTVATAGTSASTTYVLESDVDPCVALAPSAYSNKIFGYIGYNGDGDQFQPYFGVGGMYEWGQGNRAADQYGIYVKVGVGF